MFSSSKDASSCLSSTWFGAELDRSLSFYEKMGPKIGKGFLLLWPDLSPVASINSNESRDSSLGFPRPADDLNQSGGHTFRLCTG